MLQLEKVKVTTMPVKVKISTNAVFTAIRKCDAIAYPAVKEGYHEPLLCVKLKDGTELFFRRVDDNFVEPLEARIIIVEAWLNGKYLDISSPGIYFADKVRYKRVIIPEHGDYDSSELFRFAFDFEGYTHYTTVSGKIVFSTYGHIAHLEENEA